MAEKYSTSSFIEIEELEFQIEKALQPLIKNILLGQYDLETYKYWTGYVQGLKDAVLKSKEIYKNKRDSDEE